jgi:uncharacterized protein YndB with AHSA1/START domain
MAELQFHTVIKSPIETVFKLIADLPHYDKWLPPSRLYGAVTQYTGMPIQRGTTYVDQGKFSRMVGRVTEFELPRRIHFRQTTNSLFGALDIEIRYTLTSAGNFTTKVTREVLVRPTGGYRLAQGMLLGSIRTESERILAAMKAHLEA